MPVDPKPGWKAMFLSSKRVIVHLQERVGMSGELRRKMNVQRDFKINGKEVRVSVIRNTKRRFIEGATKWFQLTHLSKSVEEQHILDHIRSKCNIDSPPRTVLLYHHQFRGDYGGFAFVECANNGEAKQCVSTLNGSTLHSVQVGCRLNAEMSEMGWDRIPSNKVSSLSMYR